ncbi:MAG TPA: excinuclease ABC subunit UvrC [Sulfurovum sp.]|nr:MAG: excinuclease ABC subunit C [Sulfurovum sp. 16-42-52]OYZ48831.1 MAG: excinuclease ABC subunit C [Sulfurovum sp. 24-42-9]HQR73571.1 excinuclease ABC subunit UvrC [Sulfurovum sp.]HQS72107.1 excinuclease ABC subunit UvrC [Sulfurovum sp.]HQS77799.1 excinuclease ABC subunit UvrC [Sulfurovum sp.]
MQSVVQNLPSSAGVYQYFDARGKLLYVGKAKNLKNRVKSYWRFTPLFKPNEAQSSRILKMLQEASRLEYLLVETEEDALILENALIKQLKPKYNILLRDDKTYPYIYIDEAQPFARFEITRKIIKGKNITYYGPFPSGGRALLDALYEVYPLIQRKSCLKEGKACLFHQIGKCLAPCEGKITPEAYKDIIFEAKTSITKRKKLIKTLEEKMTQLAVQERYEEAALLRDKIQSIASLTITSGIDLANELDLDIFAIRNGDEKGVIVKLFMRGGKIISSAYTYFRHTHIFDENEAYKQALLEFYTIDTPHISKQILTAHPFEDSEQVARGLSLRYHEKIEILTPQRGAKAKLIALALQNCEELLRKTQSDTIMEQKIADLLELSVIPYRIETFDNSHMMGVAAVGGMVVWDEGDWDKKSYRQYALSEHDEYAQMKEMLTRRIKHFQEEPAPDLWILDGGQANLNLALALLKDAHVNLDVIAIAKEKLDAKAHRAKGAAKDILYTPQGILELKANDARLHWIQRQRDEAHRYAITYHQNKKRKEDTQISLLTQKGIGKATLKKLIDYFGTFEAIELASFKDIEKVTNNKIANIIKNNTE